MGPLIGITCDLSEPAGATSARVECAIAYANAVARAGARPVLLPPIVDLASAHAASVDGIVFTGGADPRMEAFGEPTHPLASPMHAQRQAYELALLAALEGERPSLPVLGVCLGMQLMALHARGRMNQHLPETLATHADHYGLDHAIVPVDADADLVQRLGGPVTPGPSNSRHRQAVTDPGDLAVVAVAHDGVIEAVASRTRPFYFGVQWHPERTSFDALGIAVFRRLVAAAGGK